MTIELKIDNGVIYALTIPRELFNLNTKAFIIETFKEWMNNELGDN